MTRLRWHRPSAFAWLITAFGVAFFAALGIWQIDRAAQKRTLFAAYATASAMPTQPLAQVDDVDAARFQHVRVRGHFVSGRGYWLDEQAYQGRVGVHAISVFDPEGSSALLLVDRGWLAWNHAPGTQPDAPPAAAGSVEITGLYAPFPRSGLRLGGNALPRQQSWPKLTLFLDPAAIVRDLDHAIRPRILLLDPAPGSGLVRAWKPDTFPPERHVGYAVTWFGLLIVALAIFIGRHCTLDKATP